MASSQSLQNMMYMATFLAAKTVPIAALSSSVIFTFSPWNTVKAIQRSKSTLQFSFAPFYFFFVQSVINTLYAYTAENPIVGFTSVLGAALGSHYVWVFYKYSKDKSQPAKLLWSAAVFIVVLLFHVMTKSPDEAAMIVGVPGNILSVLTASSPLLQLKTILSRKDASSIPFGMSMMTVVASSVWGIYGMMLNDRLIIVPNLFAFTMGIIQVSLVFIYPPPKHLKGAGAKA